MRRKIVAGNWKMNTNLDEALALAYALKTLNGAQVELIVCPPFLWLLSVKQSLNGTSIKTGAQNCAAAVSGAFTGEVSASMLASAGVEYVILGHSERRSIFGETDELILKKTLTALESNLKVILCIGETLAEREAGKLNEVIRTQTEIILKNIPSEKANSIILAYEPVWAIGTGLTASPEQAQEVHNFIRSIVFEILGEKIALEMPILYGGSCNAGNAKALFACPDIDGGLIGGASLKATEFQLISESF